MQYTAFSLRSILVFATYLYKLQRSDVGFETDIAPFLIRRRSDYSTVPLYSLSCAPIPSVSPSSKPDVHSIPSQFSFITATVGFT